MMIAGIPLRILRKMARSKKKGTSRRCGEYSRWATYPQSNVGESSIMHIRNCNFQEKLFLRTKFFQVSDLLSSQYALHICALCNRTGDRQNVREFAHDAVVDDTMLRRVDFFDAYCQSFSESTEKIIRWMEPSTWSWRDYWWDLLMRTMAIKNKNPRMQCFACFFAITDVLLEEFSRALRAHSAIHKYNVVHILRNRSFTPSNAYARTR